MNNRYTQQSEQKTRINERKILVKNRNASTVCFRLLRLTSNWFSDYRRMVMGMVARVQKVMVQSAMEPVV